MSDNAAPAASMSQQVKSIADWIASALSMAAALGWVNLAVGVLSAAWLFTQLYRFWRFEVNDLLRRHATRAAELPPPRLHTDQDAAP